MKPDHSVKWSKREKALLYHYEKSPQTSGLIAYFFEGIKMREAYGYPGRPPEEGDDRTFAQELEARGYDLTTFKFSIRKKQEPVK